MTVRPPAKYATASATAIDFADPQVWHNGGYENAWMQFGQRRLFRQEDFEGGVAAGGCLDKRLPPSAAYGLIGALSDRNKNPAPHAVVDRVEDLFLPQHLRQFRVLGKRAYQILHPTRRLVFSPQIVGSARQHRLGADRGLLDV